MVKPRDCRQGHGLGPGCFVVPPSSWPDLAFCLSTCPVRLWSCLGICASWKLWGPVCRACLRVGSTEVSDVCGVAGTAVVCSVDRAVDCVAELGVSVVGFVVAWVTVGPVAVDLVVLVGAAAEVGRAVMAEVVCGDSAGG